MTTITLSLNSCQKICLAMQNTCPSLAPFSWTTTTPSLITIQYNSTNAIIIANANVSGTGIVIFSSYNATPLFYFIITITNSLYVSSYPSPTTTQCLLSTIVVAASPPVHSGPYIINGPFNSISSPSNPNLSFFTFNVLNVAYTSAFPYINYFIPGSTASYLEVGNLGTTTSGSINFGLIVLQKTFSPYVDLSIPVATTLTGIVPPTGTPNVSLYFGSSFPSLPCTSSNYLSFAQLYGSEVTTITYIYASSVDPSGQSVSVYCNTIFPGPPGSSFQASIMVCPENYFNPSSTCLIWCGSIGITTASGATSYTINLPVAISNYANCFMLIQPTIVSLSTVSSSFSSSSTVVVYCTTDIAAGVNVNLSCFCFYNNAVSGYSFG